MAYRSRAGVLRCALALLAALVAVAAWGGLRSAPVAALTTATDWTTFGGSNQRQGANPLETTVSTGNVGSLAQSWSYSLGAPYLDTSPVVAAGVTAGGATQDLVFAGSEHGAVVALNAQTGALVWRRQLGSARSSCKDVPDGVYGVGAAPVIDRSTNRIYVADGVGAVYALDLGSGATVTGWPLQLLSIRTATEHVWGALTLVNGNLYVPLGGLCDTTPYRGRLFEIAASAPAPSVTHTFWPNGPTGPNGGGIWGWGGAAVDPVSGDLFVATGNAVGKDESAGLSEAVVRLTGSLAVVASHQPRLPGFDVDLGSSPVLFQAPGCLPQLAVESKNGFVLIYEQGNLGKGPVQSIPISPASGDFVGVAAWSAADQMLYVSNYKDAPSGPGYKHGLIGLREAAPQCSLAPAWSASDGPAPFATSPPTVANGVVYYGAGAAKRLYAYDAASGAPLWNSGSALTGSAYAAPVIVNGMLYAVAWDGRLHAFGLGAPPPPPPPPPPPGTFGNTVPGGSSDAPGAGYKFGSVYTLTATATVKDFKWYASGGNAAQAFVPAIYNTDASGAPTTLVTKGAAVSVAAHQAPGWVTSTLPSGVTIPPGNYMLALLSGPNSAGAHIYWDPGGSTAGIWNANPYPNPSPTWGQINRETEHWSFYVDY